MLVAGKAANVHKKPIVFDPVAVGATAFRRQTSKGTHIISVRFEIRSDVSPFRIAPSVAAVGYQGKCC